VGGYEDWKRQSAASRPSEPVPPADPGPRRGTAAESGAGGVTVVRRKASFKERKEYEALPARIEALEGEQAALGAEVSGADFYKQPADVIHARLARLEALPAELEAAYARWDELDTLIADAR